MCCLCADQSDGRRWFNQDPTSSKASTFRQAIRASQCHGPGKQSEEIGQSEEGKYGHKLNRPKSLEIKVKHGNFHLI